MQQKFIFLIDELNITHLLAKRLGTIWK